MNPSLSQNKALQKDFPRQRCKTCGKYLIASGSSKLALWLHPEAPCSGITDAARLTLEIEDEDLQEIWEKEYGRPGMTDHEFLNKIWGNNFLRWLIKLVLRL